MKFIANGKSISLQPTAIFLSGFNRSLSARLSKEFSEAQILLFCWRAKVDILFLSSVCNCLHDASVIIFKLVLLLSLLLRAFNYIQNLARERVFQESALKPNPLKMFVLPISIIILPFLCDVFLRRWLPTIPCPF